MNRNDKFEKLLDNVLDAKAESTRLFYEHANYGSQATADAELDKAIELLREFAVGERMSS